LLNPEQLTIERLTDARRFDLNRVREMRQLVDGSTINDLLLAVIGGGIRRYLAARDGELDESLTAVVPINLRQFEDDSGGSNVVSAMMLPLHQEIEDPVERLAAIRKASSRAKRDIAMEVNRRVVGALTDMPSPVLSIALAAVSKLAYSGQMVTSSTIVSNARSFSDARYVAGAEVKYAFGVGVLGPGVGSLHACTVYAGHLHIGFTCTPEVIPDTGEYMRCLEESFAEYDELVASKEA
jgi:WS/DGAT/MGAT family acyltransferase